MDDDINGQLENRPKKETVATTKKNSPSNVIFGLFSGLACFEFACFFFFQAEDGIRDADVTGGSDVCSSDLGIKLCRSGAKPVGKDTGLTELREAAEIGRASCREKSVDLGGRRIIKKKKK